jgi:hypothetical protein
MNATARVLFSFLGMIVFILPGCSHKTSTPPKATKNISQLQKSFIETQEFYGPEGSFPDILIHLQYPQHQALEKEIIAATGTTLEQSIKLNAAEIDALKARQDPSALYVLYRLTPQTARSIFMNRLGPKSKSTPAELCEARFALINYFAKDFAGKVKELKALMGRPVHTKKSNLYYDCGDDNWPRTLKITPSKRGLKAEMVLRD